VDPHGQGTLWGEVAVFLCGGKEISLLRLCGRTSADAVGGGARFSETQDEQSSITNPFDGVELSMESAAAMSSALEALGRPGQRQGSVVGAFEPAPHTGALSARARASMMNPFRRPLQSKDGRFNPAPLIDFSRLKILPERLLGC
jgi:hypothetical protein